MNEFIKRLLTDTRNLTGRQVYCFWRGLNVLTAALNWTQTSTPGHIGHSRVPPHRVF